ncbi:MAG: hypothetical protein ACT4NX_02430 [Deltaproteobacteria bacterium]
MPRSKSEQVLHDWVVEKLRVKYSRLYREVHANPAEERNYEFGGHFPDLIFVNYGQTMLIAEVETEETINEGEAEEWKTLSALGVQLVLIVPKEMQNAARDICWKAGIAARVKIGFFDVSLSI